MRQNEIIMQKRLRKGSELQVFRAKNYRVLFKAEPFGLVDVKPNGRRYLRTDFTTRGNAQSLANELNQLFATCEFSVTEC